ncbi:hypothetical protein OG372_03390 [Streptomyces sp. NBC_01020]|uniref:hypothetical protein n=1 Tax=unclassified Streptomyces TaxID=2593676 RepID=UPI002E22EE9F|nr:hypothetical protein OG372_03390 [Streptomyces sp. NBC_01020]WSX71249.1 hypothetical protein OG221_34195 [Streptomyces sp. NBC_00932]
MQPIPAHELRWLIPRGGAAISFTPASACNEFQEQWKYGSEWIAEQTGGGDHRDEGVGERLDHRAQEIGTRCGEVVFGEGVQGQTAWCGHRADLLRGFDTSKISRWPFIYGGSGR